MKNASHSQTVQLTTLVLIVTATITGWELGHPPQGLMTVHIRVSSPEGTKTDPEGKRCVLVPVFKTGLWAGQKTHCRAAFVEAGLSLEEANACIRALRECRAAAIEQSLNLQEICKV